MNYGPLADLISGHYNSGDQVIRNTEEFRCALAAQFPDLYGNLELLSNTLNDPEFQTILQESHSIDINQSAVSNIINSLESDSFSSAILPLTGGCPAQTPGLYS